MGLQAFYQAIALLPPGVLAEVLDLAEEMHLELPLIPDTLEELED